MPDRHRLTDDCRERITERVKSLARFDPGDHVTVEPTDHDVAYAGSDMEGMLLTISGVTWYGNDLSTPQKMRGHADRYDDSEDRWIDTPENEHFDQLFITKWRYNFEEKDSGYHAMSERSLIPWSQYRDEHDTIILERDTDGNWNTTVRLEPSDPCEVCGCNRETVRYSDQPHAGLTAGTRACAGCGNVVNSHAP